MANRPRTENEATTMPTPGEPVNPPAANSRISWRINALQARTARYLRRSPARVKRVRPAGRLREAPGEWRALRHGQGAGEAGSTGRKALRQAPAHRERTGTARARVKRVRPSGRLRRYDTT